MVRQIVILGAGGHAKVVLDAVLASGDCEVRGLLDRDPTRHGQCVLGVRVLGDDSMVPGLRDSGVTGYVIGVGSLGDVTLRKRLFDRVRGLGLEAATVVHPRATLSPSAVLGKGTCVFAGAIINAGAHLGENVIVNTGAVVEHDCRLADHVHVAPCACLGGGVTVDEGAHVGLGARVREGVRIGHHALVGAGAVVVKDVPPELVVAGVPARSLRSSTR